MIKEHLIIGEPTIAAESNVSADWVLENIGKEPVSEELESLRQYAAELLKRNLEEIPRTLEAFIKLMEAARSRESRSRDSLIDFGLYEFDRVGRDRLGMIRSELNERAKKIRRISRILGALIEIQTKAENERLFGPLHA